MDVCSDWIVSTNSGKLGLFLGKNREGIGETNVRCVCDREI